MAIRRVPCLTLTSGVPGVVYMGGIVYAIGGFNGSLRVRTVDSYDPAKDQWACVSSMQDRRSTLGSAVLNGLLYAVGGFDGSTGTELPLLIRFSKRPRGSEIPPRRLRNYQFPSPDSSGSSPGLNTDLKMPTELQEMAVKMESTDP